MFECSKCDFQDELPVLHNDPKVHPVYPCMGRMEEKREITMRHGDKTAVFTVDDSVNIASAFQAQIDVLKSLLEELEWSVPDDINGSRCPICYAFRKHTYPLVSVEHLAPDVTCKKLNCFSHDPDCKLKAAIG